MRIISYRESKFQWVSKASDGTENAYCKLCRTSIQPSSSTLVNHEKTDKHIRRVQDSATTKPLPVIHIAKEDDQVKKAEIELAIKMAYHSAIMTIDHLGEVITKNGKGSKLEKIKLHRRKCTKIIMNVVATAMKEDLTKNVKGKKYSIIVYESTDISTTKLLCAMIRYHSEK